MNVLRYCNLDDSLQEEESLVCYNALERLNRTKELDYMSYIVLRLFENTEVGYFISIFLPDQLFYFFFLQKPAFFR